MSTEEDGVVRLPTSYSPQQSEGRRRRLEGRPGRSEFSKKVPRKRRKRRHEDKRQHRGRRNAIQRRWQRRRHASRRRRRRSRRRKRSSRRAQRALARQRRLRQRDRKKKQRLDAKLWGHRPRSCATKQVDKRRRRRRRRRALRYEVAGMGTDMST
ncbi:hypothetical protein K466DRAFT_98977 [Polyporus arcularius HHB13444]|uniref:Uncharacterized protein n=1 Tax=Polyporus arcularius HHB13444 TaxID=1314778 RepID=A0A5C3PEU2_9APHY|nr:hypothetical protein K466DRAFT_98977 [Polyporus arcularius HHB13444]